MPVCGRSLFCPMLYLMLAGIAGAQAQTQVDIEGIQSDDLSLAVMPILGKPTPVVMDVEQLDQEHRVARGDLSPFRVYYRYDEAALFPDSDTKSYLSLFVLDERHSSLHPKNAFPVEKWRFRLDVLGTFIDRHLTLPIKVSNGTESRNGDLQVTAHQRNPRQAIALEGGTAIELDVPTRARKVHPIPFINKSCCPVHLIDYEISPKDDAVWRQLEIEDSVPLPPTSQATTWFEVVTEVKSSLNLWENALPNFTHEKPHAEFKIAAHFEVEGGQVSRVDIPVRIRFRPSPLVLLAAVTGGAFLATIARLLYLVRRDSEPPWWDGSIGSRLKAFVAQLSRSIVVAWIIFFLFLWVKGQKKVILFDLNLDPTQLLPALVVGFVGGIRPDFFFERFLKLLKSSSATAVILLLVLLVPPGAEAQTSNRMSHRAFRPVSLAYDHASDSIYVLSSSGNQVFLLDSSREKLHLFSDLGRQGSSMDLCFFENAEDSFLIVVAAETLGSGLSVRSHVSRIRLRDGDVLRETFPFFFFRSVACDPANERVLVSESRRLGVYSIEVSLSGNISSKPRLERTVRAAGPLALWGGNIYRAEEQLLLRESEGDDVSTEPFRVSKKLYVEIADISPNPIDFTLLVVDAAAATIDEVRPQAGLVTIRVDNRYLDSPRAVQIDSKGTVWVCDVVAKAVLRFSPADDAPTYFRPSE